jgi:hypothetical protein
MISFSFIDFAKLVLTFILGIFQSLPGPAAAPTSMFNLGDKLDGMTLTTGAADAHPLWAFCSSREENDVITANVIRHILQVT